MITTNSTNLEDAIKELTEKLKKRDAMQVDDYRYEWETAEQQIANIHTQRRFSGSVGSISDYTENPDDVRKAHEIWLRLREAFNKEGRVYDPELFISRLGSVGDVSRREVMRSAWWDAMGGDDLGDYDTLTGIIELLHHGEELETGTIIFGS